MDGNGFPVLRLTCLKNGRIDLSERKTGSWTREDAAQFIVKRDDFFVSRGDGSLPLVGRGGLVDIEPDGVAYPDTLIRVRVCRTLDTKYLRLAWESDVLRKQIESAAHTTAGIHKVSQADLRGLAIPIPPTAEQHEVVRRVEAVFKLAHAIERRVTAATARAEKLTQAILAKAFRGELVPTEAELARRENRPYEPASTLLARIRSERTAEPSPRRNGKRVKRSRS